MVSGNPEVPDDENEELIDFNSLPPAEQQAVAERLLRMKSSGWKPFWCPISTCDGQPHWQTSVGAMGQEEYHFAAIDAAAGPNGEPLGDRVYADEAGDWVIYEDFAKVPQEYTEVGRPLLDPQWAHNHAREDQRLLPWNKPWTLFVMSGRGSGKTRLGVEFVTLCARKGLTGAILGRRGTELVNTHVAEIIANAHPDFMPVHLASKDILVWPEVTLPDGSTVEPITYLFSAERPENIRSVNLSYAWVDEAAFMDEIKTAWMNLKLATRVRRPGNPIHFLITSTPTGTPWVIEMEDNEDVTVRRVSTYANRANLDPDFLAALEKEYEGTRMGRQELHGEVLRDVEGAMWNDGMFRHERLNADQFADFIDGLDDTVVSVDPAGSKGKRSDATGIIGVGVHRFDDSGQPLNNENYSVVARGTLKGTPSEWAERTFKVARLIKARRIIAEKNFGGDMVKQVLKDWAALNPEASKNHEGEEFTIVVRHAVLSKETRAEATVGKYEQGRVTHVSSPTAYGDLSELETQQVTWVPKSRGGRMPSPNDIDALVWGVRELESSVTFKAQTASQNTVKAVLKRKGPGRRAA